ncbi:hypothetical protein HII31_07225 [Pseudocercospora fuligena]|uniref:Uncharacterized protein n=1 Tax=Pseudocercospora fuligena TaxID=685502 RepID=A0A8H6VHZ1_9PEZI|nr:hypothetical protein HII31_07225 [Pseudocercospora fuligena]
MADNEIDICFPIIKFSHATGLIDNQIPWDHISGKNLDVLIQGSSRIGRSLTLRVIQGTTDLEHVDIGSYIDAALEVRRQEGNSVALERLPIFGITKESLFAIRYTVNGEPRRVQLRLQDVEQCKHIVQVLEHRGLMYQEQRPKTARPGTATSRPGTAYSEDRPSTAQVSSPHFEPPPPQKAYQRPREAFSYVPRKSSIDARLVMHSHNASRTIRPYQVPQPPLFPREEASVARGSKIAGPTTAEIYGARPEPYRASGARNFQTTTGPSLLRESRPSRPITTTHSQEELPRTFEQHAAPSSSDPGLPPRSADPAHSQNMSSTENHILPQWSSDPPDGRPVTALSTTSVADFLEQQIPPRRELPFKRPSSSSKSDASSRPGSSALTLPPLKRARADKSIPTLPARPNTTLKKADRPTLDQSARPATTSLSSNTAQSVRGAAERSEETHHVSSDIPPQPSTSRPISMDELLYGKRTLSMRKDHTTIPRVESLTDAPHEIVSPPGSAISRVQNTAPGQTTSASTFVNAQDQSLNRAYAAVSASAVQTEETSLEEYEAQSLEDRKAVLDKFMMDMLENPAFTTLCEDVENCWRRIALGL